MADPLILTLRLDAATFARLNALRQRLFPDRGYRLPAHLTLFHHLPGDEAPRIAAELEELAAGTAPIPLAVTEVLKFNPGAAYKVQSPRLKDFRAGLAERWEDWLTRQDRSFRAHVTVQNKVASRDDAFPALAAEFKPFEATGTGLLLWHYRGGPWEPAGDYRFGGIE